MRWRLQHLSDHSGDRLRDAHGNPIFIGDLIVHHHTYGIVTAVRPDGGHRQQGGLSYRKADGSHAVCHESAYATVLLPGFAPFPLIVPTLSLGERARVLAQASSDLRALLRAGYMLLGPRDAPVGPRDTRRMLSDDESQTLRATAMALSAEAVSLDALLEHAPVPRDDS